MTLLLSEAEILELAGGLTQPRRQLEELHRCGFWRARLDRSGRVILEREHYRAVCRGALPDRAIPAHTDGPKLRPLKAA